VLYNTDNTKFYYSQINQDVTKKSLDFILTHKDKFNHQTWNCKIKTSRDVTNNILNMVELHELKMNILSHIENYMHQKENFIDGYIFESWINVYEKEFFQEFHTHLNDCRKYICGVIYLTEDNSNIEFNVNQRIPITPKFSDILLFPDSLAHRVVPNEKEQLRISLAFNYHLCQNWNKVTF